MKDKWMNIGYEDDELKPYQEPPPDLSDISRIGKYSNNKNKHIFKKICPKKYW